MGVSKKQFDWREIGLKHIFSTNELRFCQTCYIFNEIIPECLSGLFPSLSPTVKSEPWGIMRRKIRTLLVQMTSTLLCLLAHSLWCWIEMHTHVQRKEKERKESVTKKNDSQLLRRNNKDLKHWKKALVPAEMYSNDQRLKSIHYRNRTCVFCFGLCNIFRDLLHWGHCLHRIHLCLILKSYLQLTNDSVGFGHVDDDFWTNSTLGLMWDRSFSPASSSLRVSGTCYDRENWKQYRKIIKYFRIWLFTRHLHGICISTNWTYLFRS